MAAQVFTHTFIYTRKDTDSSPYLYCWQIKYVQHVQKISMESQMGEN